MPKLSRKLFNLLKNKGYCEKIWMECCTRNFTTYGCLERANDYSQKLIKYAYIHGIERIVPVCTNCHSSLKEVCKDTNVEIISVYEILDFEIKPGDLTYAIHDSCCDREAKGLFSNKTREYLLNNHFNLVEMRHSQNNSICCGRGGGAQHYRPQYTQEYVNMRLLEAHEANVDVNVVYCPLCGMSYLDNKYGIKVKHILEIMLELDSELYDASIKFLYKEMLFLVQQRKNNYCH